MQTPEVAQKDFGVPQWETAREGNEQRGSVPRDGPCFGMAGFKSEGPWTQTLYLRKQSLVLGTVLHLPSQRGDCCAQSGARAATLEQSQEEQGCSGM